MRHTVLIAFSAGSSRAANRPKKSPKKTSWANTSDPGRGTRPRRSLQPAGPMWA